MVSRHGGQSVDAVAPRPVTWATELRIAEERRATGALFVQMRALPQGVTARPPDRAPLECRIVCSRKSGNDGASDRKRAASQSGTDPRKWPPCAERLYQSMAATRSCLQPQPCSQQRPSRIIARACPCFAARPYQSSAVANRARCRGHQTAGWPNCTAPIVAAADRKLIPTCSALQTAGAPQPFS
jgi:hypothetical protein